MRRMSTSAPLHKRAILWGTAILTVLVVAGLCLTSESDVTASVRQRRVERLNAAVENVYTEGYQRMADEQLAELRGEGGQGLDAMVLAENPYGTNTTSLYVYFTTDAPAKVTYTVSAEGYPDFTRTAQEGGAGGVAGTMAASADLDGSDAYQSVHEFLVLGLIPRVSNTITFTLEDTDGNTTERTITRQGPKLLGDEEVRLEATVAPAAGADLGDGLYAVLGNDSDDQDFMYLYDTAGVLRGEIPLLYYRAHRLLFDGDGLMWFSASTKHLVGMNRLGKLVKIIDLGDRFILHHDYALDADGSIVSLATELGRDDHAVQDQVIKVDTRTGKVSRLLDAGELFADYKASTTHAGIDESDPTATGRWDWIHFNTIQLTDDGGAILSARETSTIIKIDDLETDPTVAWMAGERSVWDGFPAIQDLFLDKDGDFPDTGGQHSVTVETDPSLGDGRYYLTMFDNNFGYASTRPDFDWTVIDGISTAQSSKDPHSHSQFRRCLIDERAGTYAEVDAFDVPYSPYVSSEQVLDNGAILVDSGMQGLIGTYSPDGELLAQYRMEPDISYLYRVYQYGFHGFYFQ
ncbi:aryl-sulfate sulfotransferase [Bifidobacterium pullorum subsp. saeculare]|uniref:Aryl-sulfate sulfotransferase n=2 Tax=Bifidobacterium pullorum TaxID=78448 RepID=A0A938WYT9_9BIFI|nr:aryl-sulfate sulfotransferase [Bifidobacterium pullorum]MBM6699147.1 aryl-sulfate sulfotransferase [Bifidobacterium pullorum subsp. saeculare]